MMSSANSLYAILVGVAAGVFALAFVANEIGSRAGLPPNRRFLLAGGLGFGVFAFAIKAILITGIATIGHDVLAPESGSQAAPAFDDPNGPWPERPPLSPFWATWQALPAIPPEPAGNRTSPAKIALGKRLFEDPDLSSDRTISCSSCHGLAGGGDDGRPVALGVGGQAGGRNAPTVLDAAYLGRLFWDGRAGSLEEQAKGPLLNPIEMGMPSGDAVVARIRAKPAYAAMFEAAFGTGRPVDFDMVAKAIAAFERTLVSRGAAYDRFVAGEDGALDAAQLRGMALFREIGCRTCHVDPTFSAAGLVKPNGSYRLFPVFPDEEVIARYRLAEEDRKVWRVPSLRNVELTAPYLHNGSAATLEEAVRIMAVLQLGLALSNDPADRIPVEVGPVDEEGRRDVHLGRRRSLSDADVADIAAFLRGLTGWPVSLAERY